VKSSCGGDRRGSRDLSPESQASVQGEKSARTEVEKGKNDSQGIVVSLEGAARAGLGQARAAIKPGLAKKLEDEIRGRQRESERSATQQVEGMDPRVQKILEEKCKGA